MKNRKCVYAGSFDPLTNGHLWIIERGSELFDELITAVGMNPQKEYTFSLEERVDMLKEVTQKFPNVEVGIIKNKYLVDYAKEVDARYIIRGIRSTKDYTYESGMQQFNMELNPEITTVFFIPPPNIGKISSSTVKDLIGPKGWEERIKNYVPEVVHKKLLERFK